MKKTINKSLLLIALLPVSLLAHDGHVHTGTFLENAAHFILTNGYFFVPIIVISYFLIKYLKSSTKIRNK